MSFNWIDWIILLIFIYEAYQGWLEGFVTLGAGFIAFFVSMWLAIVYHQPVAGFFMEKFGIPSMWSTLISYVLIVAAGQMIIMRVLHSVIQRIPEKFVKSKFNEALGAIVSALNSLTVVAFVLLILISLPLKGTVQKDIKDSFVGGAIVRYSDRFGGPIKLSMKEFEKTATKFLTIEPNSKETLVLNIDPKASDLIGDDQDERKMLALVNAERAKVNAPALVVDVRILQVARKHSTDMFMRRYFAHIDPDGKNPGMRLSDGEVKYSLAGENLAYAPDIDRAFQGLMDSPEHKKNMLDPLFRHTGIGIISTDSFGIMVTQDFTN
jgi:uncharacterized protein YkwD